MKKIFMIGLACFLIIGVFLFARYKYFCDAGDVIYLNASDEKSYLELSGLQKALKKEGKRVVLSDKRAFKSGKINLYATNNTENLPKVLDTNEINFLWVETLPDNWALEKLRDFDVIVAKTYPLFSHLKAVNVRTAYIPDIIEVTEPKKQNNNGKVMYWGDNDSGFSLSLYLAGKNDFRVDVYGRGFDKLWPKDEIKENGEDMPNFGFYKFVLLDQSEDNIRDEVIDKKIIKVLENGGIPLVRYNYGIHKIFGDTLLMYASEGDFLVKFKQLITSGQDEIDSYKKELYEISKQWNSQSVAKKFIELFEIMNQKRI